MNYLCEDTINMPAYSTVRHIEPGIAAFGLFLTICGDNMGNALNVA